jgi:hypothetical protein
MKRNFLLSGIVITAGIVIMTVAAIGGWYARDEWSDAYHVNVNSGGMYGAMDLYEAELARAAYAWLFDTGVIVAFGGLAILAFGAAFEKTTPKPEMPKAHKQALAKDDKAREDSQV